MLFATRLILGMTVLGPANFDRAIIERAALTAANEVHLDASLLARVRVEKVGMSEKCPGTGIEYPLACTTAVGGRVRIWYMADMNENLRVRVLEHELRHAAHYLVGDPQWALVGHEGVGR